MSKGRFGVHACSIYTNADERLIELVAAYAATRTTGLQRGAGGALERLCRRPSRLYHAPG
jgi:hypothetical protein